jgi:hypothetical protein
MGQAAWQGIIAFQNSMSGIIVLYLYSPIGSSALSQITRESFGIDTPTALLDTALMRL